MFVRLADSIFAVLASTVLLVRRLVCMIKTAKDTNPNEHALGWDGGSWQGADGLVQKQSRTCASRLLQRLEDRSETSVLNRDMVARLMVGKYKNTWRGHVLMKDALSLHMYSALMERERPRTIIDLGTAGGGSAVWFASQGNAIGIDCVVVTIDIVDQRTSSGKADMEALGNINMICADLCDFDRIRDAIQHLPHPWLISEDCHVDAEVILNGFDSLLRAGDYIVFEDTHACTPDLSWMDAEDIDNYKCGTFARAKMKRIRDAITRRRDTYMVDASLQDLYGYNGLTHVNSVFVATRSENDDGM